MTILRWFLYLFAIAGIFVLGWIAAVIQISPNTIEKPDFQFLYHGNVEKSSPQNRILEDQIIVRDGRVIINLDGATWSSYADTNSMDPILDSEANGIELPVQSPEELHAGDIISFADPYGRGLVVHRIIAIGEDDQGWFARTRGDNNITNDPYKIRFDQIHGVLVGILY